MALMQQQVRLGVFIQIEERNIPAIMNLIRVLTAALSILLALSNITIETYEIAKDAISIITSLYTETIIELLNLLLMSFSPHIIG